jgi:cobalt-zinc-cadmium efflux system outer membrane protein
MIFDEGGGSARWGEYANRGIARGFRFRSIRAGGAADTTGKAHRVGRWDRTAAGGDLMHRRLPKGMAVAVGLMCLAGCLHPVSEQIDQTVCELTAQPWDLQPLEHGSAAETKQVPDSEGAQQASHQPEAKEAEEPKRPGEGPAKQLARGLDELLPGGKVPELLPPPPDRKDPMYEQKLKEWQEKNRKLLPTLFPPLPPVGEDLPDRLGPEGRPFTLADLQKLARANSPAIRQAVARVKEAQGAAIQAGLPPNPNIGYEADQVGTAGGPGYQGGFIEQKVIVSNKLQLARAAAALDVRNAELALRRAEADLATRVRGAWFAYLVALESVRINRSLVQFANDVYQTQVKRVVRAGVAAAYEPIYLRALATQTRANLVQARNRRIASWKQLASAVGVPGLPPTALAGRLDIPIPLFEYQEVLARVLAHHTDVRTAENLIQQAHYRLELAQATPIPDPTCRFMLQKDRTGPPYEVAPTFIVQIPLPVWDRNQGGILEAQAVADRQSEEPHRVRVELTRALAEAFEKYQDNRVLLGYYRDQILPDLVRVYRGVYRRYQVSDRGEDGAPGFNDVVVAQQNLAQSIGTYIQTLGQVWQAVVEVADLLQTPDLFGVTKTTQPVGAIPDLAPLPCCHPCSPLPDVHQHAPL